MLNYCSPTILATILVLYGIIKNIYKKNYNQMYYVIMLGIPVILVSFLLCNSGLSILSWGVVRNKQRKLTSMNSLYM